MTVKDLIKFKKVERYLIGKNLRLYFSQEDYFYLNNGSKTYSTGVRLNDWYYRLTTKNI